MCNQITRTLHHPFPERDHLPYILAPAVIPTCVPRNSALCFCKCPLAGQAQDVLPGPLPPSCCRPVPGTALAQEPQAALFSQDWQKWDAAKEGLCAEGYSFRDISSVSKFSLRACYTLSTRLRNNQGFNCDRHALPSGNSLHRTAQWLESISNPVGAVVLMEGGGAGGCRSLWGLGSAWVQRGKEVLAKPRAAGGMLRWRQQPGKRCRLSEAWAGMVPSLG